ncbi:MAG: glycosyltransferase family 39 protein [Anaerolineae bacterium]|nr:glycosyltransferase family 39 protein [Anaerolineae bacterium]
MNQTAKAHSRSNLWIVLLFFVVGVLLRLVRMDVPINVDEGHWIRRGPQFLAALLSGHPADTYLRHHPGVTNMWLIGASLSFRYLLRSLLPADDLARQSTSLLDYLQRLAGMEIPSPLALYLTARLLFAFVTSGGVVAFYALCRRLFGDLTARLATVLLSLEPFFLAYQRALTTDGLQSNFTWLALLAFFLYLRSCTHPRRWLALSAFTFAIALLSKVAALLFLPGFLFAFLFHFMNATPRPWKPWRIIIADLVLWLALVLGAILVLWPATWANPVGTWHRFAYDLFDVELEGHKQFFLGQPTNAPGPSFYLVVLAYRTSPVLLIGALVGLVVLFAPSWRYRLPNAISFIPLVLALAIVLLAISVQATKIDRYVIPLFPGLALLTAASLVALTTRLFRILVPAAFALQLAILLLHAPYYLTYFNPLFGGISQAVRLLMIGNGELLDQAANWLNVHATPQKASVATWYSRSFAPYYHGPTQVFYRWLDTNYVMLYINQIQRLEPSPKLIRYFEIQRPVYVIHHGGVDYIRIYRGPNVPLSEASQLPNSVRLNFGGSALLLGFEVETPEVTAGYTATLTLYWQAIAPFDAPDYSVYVGLRNQDGQRLAKSDSPPVGGFLPVYQWPWPTRQIVRDVHAIRIPPGTPPGTYTLEVGFFSSQLQKALEIYGPDGPRGTAAALTTLTVRRPEHPPSPETDWQIAHRVDIPVGGIRLVGYEWPQLASEEDRGGRPLLAGEAVPITLLWQASETPPVQRASLYLQLRAGDEVWRRARGHPIGGSYPPSQWTTGELVREVWEALLPADAPSGLYQLEIVADTGSQFPVPVLGLGTIELHARQRSFQLPHPAFSQRADLGGVARLLGYELPAVAQSGQPITVTLYWQALSEPDQNYTRFTHLLADGQIVAQHDGVPGNGAFPTTSWIAGEIMTDTFELILPATLPSGSYHLVIGFYDPLTGQRLTTAEGADTIPLVSPLQVR